ncbi:NmrA-like family protein [Corynespora cassiicola Philippines]|uniref:NmrA-like family protein n=1 Tax=Corynespora cassiicola Philippines TaxID=1448308 RepID=A0A2T2NNV4_CORCC|nr:NmrA-like family protein [Corynespora cassiicola Philippines]
MAPTILVVGATGNTGQPTVQTLSKLLESSQEFSGHRILAQTRSSNGLAAQQLAKLPHVDVVEYHWPDITADWLRERQVVRAFIASHNQPNQFAEESTFHVAALGAGVEYVVRISTTAANVHPDFKAYYPRSHWAIEAMLGTPEFSNLRWTSLQPNLFSRLALSSAAEAVKTFRNTGTQEPLRLILSADAPVGIINPQDVGTVAAHLLLQKDTSAHNKAKYVLNGPEDITGNQIVNMVEERIGTKIENVVFKDTSLIDQMAAATKDSKGIILTIKHAVVTMWEGKCAASTTSKEIFDIAAPKSRPTDVFEALLAE